MKRVIQREILDDLPAHDPEAQRSRQDLRRINFVMAHTSIFASALSERSKPRRWVDLGSGDGYQVLRILKSLQWREVDIVLVDQQSLAEGLRQQFEQQGCSLTFVQQDVFDFLEGATPPCDLMTTNLFLHHFKEMQLIRLFLRIAHKCRHFVACEPARSSFALLGSHLLGLMGCNRVTRHDAVVSVKAGFSADELSPLWPDKIHWQVRERHAGLFSHLFTAIQE